MPGACDDVNVTNLNLSSCSRSVVLGQCTKLTEVVKEIKLYNVAREHSWKMDCSIILLPIILPLWTTPHIILDNIMLRSLNFIVFISV